jgi:hypothetical protein
MDDGDARGPGEPETRRQTEQQIFDEQVARASGKAVVMFGGLGLLAALVLSTIALVIAAGKNSTTVTVPAAPTTRRWPAQPPTPVASAHTPP